MVLVRNKEDLKNAYDTLYILTEMSKKKPLSEGAKAYIKQTKQAIREYNKKPLECCFIEGDYDSYTEKIIFPKGLSVAEAEDFFDDNYRLVYYPSQYDCTGQCWTASIKFMVREDGSIVGYHHVLADV